MTLKCLYLITGPRCNKIAFLTLFFDPERLCRLKFLAESISPSISFQQHSLFKIIFPLSVKFEYSPSSTSNFDPYQNIDVKIESLKVESEIKAIGIIARTLQKENLHRTENNYSSKAKLIHSRALGNF